MENKKTPCLNTSLIKSLCSAEFVSTQCNMILCRGKLNPSTSLNHTVLHYTVITIYLHFPARHTDLPSHCCGCQPFCCIFEKQEHANFISKRVYLSEKAFKMFYVFSPKISLCNIAFLHAAIVATSMKKMILIQQWNF